ncbi:RING finger protein [Penicillium brasilianum]|uniref:RING finger protein n=1 Tax=Penicillium brasilianum TaxID=104259 RepID=A0A1S9RCA0_PENBI|nr:RING finger protein [Penicillium brasilianum]
MGQSASAPRDPSDTGHPDYAPFSIDHNSILRHEDMNNRQPTEQGGGAGSSSGMESNLQNGQDPSHGQLHELPESWQQPIRYSGGLPQQMRSIEEESTEHEPSTREYRSAAIARMAARRQSAMSRLGSRILPNSVIRGLLNSQEETPAEGHAHRHGLVSRTPPRSESAHSSGRFSPFSALGSRGVIRRRNTRGPYFIPQRADSSAMSDGGTSSSLLDSSAEQLPESSRASWRRARLQRVRHSLSTPISHMFGQPASDIPSSHQRSSSFSGDLPSAMDTRLDFGEPLPELDSVEPGVQPDRPLSAHETSAGLVGSRALPSLLRARAARAMRREEQTPLSRVLQLAAAAIAAQLSGTTGPALPNIQALGNEGVDGSLENFIQSLQHVTTAPAQQPSSAEEGASQPGVETPAAPVNFLRVFRFANSDSPLGAGLQARRPSGSENSGPQSDGMSIDEPPEGAEGRTVTLVVVGVRSVPAGNGGHGEEGPPAPGGAGLDALLGLPFLPQNAIPRPPEGVGDPAQRADARSRLHAARQARPGVTPREILRQPGSNISRRMSDAGPRPLPPFYPFASAAQSDSPPGPHPPPSTPAEPGMSAVSSGTSTPSRRPSSASTLSPTHLPHLHENQPLQPTAEPSEQSAPPSAARQRRRSDSEFARHRALGSGSLRRNGVVEPDQPPPSGGRSWLIYVVGTNLSENHPALTTPSLFTDNPTYEDMILLSSLLGPAKPPVASQDDVNSAGGLFRLVEYSGSLVAESISGAGAIQIQDGERCLICLSDYEVAEEVRELAKCKHVFHRDCIDQWLTTGRNSCPLCRGQGVQEASNDEGTAGVEPAPNSAPEGTAI